MTAVSGGMVGAQFTLPSGALLTLNANGTFSYDPNHQFDYLPTPGSGASNLTITDTFTYTITGGDTATVTVTVSGVDTNDVLYDSAGIDTWPAASATTSITSATPATRDRNGGRRLRYRGATADYTCRPTSRLST